MFAFINRFLAFLSSSKTNDVLLKLLLLLTFLYYIFTRQRAVGKKEGFEQSQPFILKRGVDAYDEFYAPVYEHLYNLPTRTTYEVKEVVKATQPDPDKSVFLDVGCGTGMLVAKLAKQGFAAYGIDKSQDMVKYSKTKYPDAHIKCGDVLHTMEFEPATFTHILCMNFTIYSFRDKATFFRNCARWLVPHGYLIIHLVNPRKFNAITPAGMPTLMEEPQKYSKTRITDTLIDFTDFKYKSSYDFGEKGRGNGGAEVVLTETFTDGKSGKVRQNEHTMFMEDEKVILDLGEKCGFVQKGQFSMAAYNRDAHQHIYILEYVPDGKIR